MPPVTSPTSGLLPPTLDGRGARAPVTRSSTPRVSFAGHGVQIDRVLTDNAWAYRRAARRPWVDLASSDVAASRDFYAKVFDWQEGASFGLMKMATPG